MRSWYWIGWADAAAAAKVVFDTSPVVPISFVSTGQFLNHNAEGALDDFAGLVVCSALHNYSEEIGSLLLSDLKNKISAILRCHPVNIIYISSASVYGLRETKDSITELEPLMGTSAYAREKRGLEDFLTTQAASVSKRCVILRAPGLFGKDESYERRTSLVDRLVMGECQFTVDFKGEQLRDFLHVSDLLEIIKCFAQMLDSDNACPVHNVYNVTNGRPFRINEIFDLAGKLNPNIDIELFDSKGPRHCVLDGNRIDIEVGFEFTCVSDFLISPNSRKLSRELSV